MARRKGVVAKSLLKLKGEGVYGINSVLLALQGKHRNCHRVLLQESKSDKKDAARLSLQKINDLAVNQNIKVTFCRLDEKS